MSRTVLVGLDGATFTVLGPLMESGDMPVLRDLVRQGASAELLSTANPVTPVAWTSLMTGRSPGGHAIFDFVRYEERPTGGFFTVSSSRDRRAETVWQVANRQQRTVTCLNFFGTFPAEPIERHMVSGFVPWRHLRRAVHPPALFDRLKELLGPDTRELAMDLDLEKQCIQGLPPERYRDWIGLHLRRERNWFTLLRQLMIDEPTDLTAIVFDGVDKLQHVFWRFLDPAFSAADASAADLEVRELCLQYFRQLDRFLGDIVALAGPDARVFLASDHGFGPTWEIFYANVWLNRHGYLAWAAGAEPDGTGKLTADRLKNHLELIDWSRTTAYALTPSSNGIRIRRAGPDHPGGVPAGEYAAFRDRLARELLDYRAPGSGAPVVVRVQTREQAFPGPHQELAPDLLLTLRDSGFLSILNADAPLKPRAEIAGTHRPEGIFAAFGPGIRRGATLPALSILDVAPMLLYSLGLAIPEDMEGMLPAGIFEDALLAHAPPRRAEPAPSPAVDGLAADAAGEAEILDRLRALGYLE